MGVLVWVLIVAAVLTSLLALVAVAGVAWGLLHGRLDRRKQ